MLVKYIGIQIGEWPACSDLHALFEAATLELEHYQTPHIAPHSTLRQVPKRPENALLS